MGKTIRLASVLLKCSLGSGKTDETHKIDAKKILNLLMLILLIPVIVILFRTGVGAQELFSALEGEELILRALLFLASLIIFVVGIFSCINTFYLSSNLDCLLVMPFTSAQITGAKFIVAAFYEYYISIAVIGPLLIGFGYGEGAGLLYWIGTVLTMILLPLLPLAYSAIIAMIIMRVLGGAKNKQRMTALGAFGLIFASIAYSVIGTSFRNLKQVQLEQVLDHMIQMVKNITWIFPDVPFLVNIMHGQDVLSIVFALVTIIAAMVVFLGVAKIVYLAGAIGMQETSASHKELSAEQMEKYSRQRGIVASYTRKELKTVFRTPTYYISCLIITLGWPVILLLPQVIENAIGTGNKMEWVGAITNHITEPETLFVMLFWVILLVNSFCTLLNGMAPSAISREGQSFFIMKQLPVSYKNQLKAKRNAALVICGTGGVLYMALADVYFIVAKDLPLWTMPMTILVSACIVFIMVDLQMIVGLIKPRLEWDSEADAIKMRAAFILFIIIALFSFMGLVLEWNPFDFIEISPWVFIGGFCLVLIVIAVIIDRCFYLYGVKKLEKM
ncbi:MAG: hypothetical protein PHC41_15215 [Lachnospiraceae bacterium]|nr:hypothetical protein [Lachnospiraceae bacterium]MDD3617553.1 hypothetical protein [Lachnospiraceae bacterium]